MKDKEFEEYFRKVKEDAVFTSHVEKGTIELQQEYYNLLEERIRRIIDENEELKREKEKLIVENNLMKSLLTNHSYTYSIR